MDPVRTPLFHRRCRLGISVRQEGLELRGVQRRRVEPVRRLAHLLGNPVHLVPTWANGRSSATHRHRRRSAAVSSTRSGGASLMNEQTIDSVRPLIPLTTPDPVADHPASRGGPSSRCARRTYDRHDDGGHGREARRAGSSAVLLRDEDRPVPQAGSRDPRLGDHQDAEADHGRDRRITTLPRLDPLRKARQANWDATAGWAVDLVDPDGTLIPRSGPPGPAGTWTSL